VLEALIENIQWQHTRAMMKILQSAEMASEPHFSFSKCPRQDKCQSADPLSRLRKKRRANLFETCTSNGIPKRRTE